MNTRCPSSDTHTHTHSPLSFPDLIAADAVLTANGAIPMRAPLALMNLMNVTIISEDR